MLGSDYADAPVNNFAMQIKRMVLKNFRNIGSAELQPGSQINFLLGDNAQGKTNLVEAIYATAMLKSFRTRNSAEFIQDGEEQAVIGIELLNDQVSNRLNLVFTKNAKQLTINGKKPATNNYYQYINVIIFHPDEVNYISSYPAFRRNLLDRSIFYTDFNYIETYRNYTKCLKQRNAFLKSGSSGVDCWQEQLLGYGATIIQQRLKYIDRINEILKTGAFDKNCSETYALSYSRQLSDRSAIDGFLSAEFMKKKSREQLLGYTLVGPHRDDILFTINGKSASSYASQGQKRSLVISYKTAQILDYQQVHGDYPILILDDMTSELDSSRKNLLLENLLENSGQVFITSTDFKSINNSEQLKRFRVQQGEISVVS